MNWFKNLKIKTKMLISFMLVIALMAVLAAVAIIELQGVDGSYSSTIRYSVEEKMYMIDFRTAVLDIRRVTGLASSFAATDDNSRIESFDKSAQASYADGVKALDSFEALCRDDPLLPKAEVDSFLARAADLRRLFGEYKSQSMEPIIEASYALDHGKTMEVILAGTAVATELMNNANALVDDLEADMETEVAAAQQTAKQMVWQIVAITAVALLIAIIIALYISGLIVKPLIPLTNFMTKAGGTGNITIEKVDEAAIGKFAALGDELGQLIRGTVGFVQHVAHIAEELETIASGDLTTNIELLSESDLMGKSLQHMANSLNDMFSEINNSTAQVSTGAKQIADGSQALAQGSTAQAASVQELSASIVEIANKTKDNADMAGRAAMLANTIMGNAEKGSRQMDEMMAAVKDINDASRQISKVIKVIDDIAFQTNILALNAAVEAARAGQHGKGFAVVAEEVRNLASKSAEAAKETGNLIANSSEKAELGSRIAEETSSSLTEIVQGINESSKLISQIAQSSDEQSAGITQINKGIDQVAQVIQQNSATAEQSAAASEEMSGQSSMLEELVAQFKLKDSGRRQLPSSAPKKQIAMPGKPAGGDYGKY